VEPIWEAVRFEAALRAGRTKPLLIECQLPSGASTKRERFVTKAVGLPEVHDFSLCHEFVGAKLARLVGLDAPDSALVNLSEAFLEASKTDLIEAGVQPAAGLAVGSTFVPNLQPFPASASLSEVEMIDAARIYAFDLLVQNADRRSSSPNCGRAGGRIVPYDFENAFGFRFAIAPPDPWRASACGFAAQHLFHRPLQQHERNWVEIFAPFSVVTPADVAALCGTLPAAWGAIGAEILAHIVSVLGHWLQFSQEVAATLGDSL
jgi:hypothetical protein